MRIDIELSNELRRIAELNGIKLIEASKEVAKILQNNRNKKFKITMEEIKF